MPKPAICCLQSQAIDGDRDGVALRTGGPWAKFVYPERNTCYTCFNPDWHRVWTCCFPASEALAADGSLLKMPANARGPAYLCPAGDTPADGHTTLEKCVLFWTVPVRCWMSC